LFLSFGYKKQKNTDKGENDFNFGEKKARKREKKPRDRDLHRAFFFLVCKEQIFLTWKK
jgi:hypothetical protein